LIPDATKTGRLRSAERPRRFGVRTTLAMLVLLAVFAGCQQASGERNTGEPPTGQKGSAAARTPDAEATTGDGAGAVARAGDVEARAGARAVARAGDVVAKAGAGEARSTGNEHLARKVELQMQGERGTGFSGTCKIGQEKKEIRGRVPERFVYELDGRSLGCEVRKHGPGALEIVLTSGDDRHVQRTDSAEATLEFSYSGQGFSSSMQSSGSSGQTSTSSSSTSSH
jgi:hypothetical protein